MITSVYAHDIMQIIHSNHKSPHYVLGQHMVDLIVRGEKQCIPSIRVFMPDVLEITVINADKPAEKWVMEEVHDGGFFEALLWDKKERINYSLHIKGRYGHDWDMDDPYSGWVEGMTDFDRYLFNRSMHYKIYEKMGAHLMNRDGKQGVFFSVWAPDAARVSLIGNFNSWDGRRDTMEMLVDSGVWVLFKPGIGLGEVYKYEVKTRDGRILTKADPYATFAEIRPKTASVVHDLSGYAWNDAAWIEARDSGEVLNQPVSVYEVHLGSWRRVPEEDNRYLTYKEFSEKLVDYVKDMGFTHIELLPIEEHPFDGSWGYQVTGYFAPTSRFGRPEELQYLVDRCHQAGIGVLLDWVPAHFPKDDHGLANFDGTALYEHADPRRGEHAEWGTKIFNFGRREVQNFLISNALYWIDMFHFDGLRVDAVASMLYLDYSKKEGEWLPNEHGGRENLDAVEFIQHMNSMIYQYFPGVLMMAEESTSWPNVSRPTYVGGLGFGFKWNMGWMHDVLEYIQHDPIHRKYHHHQLTFGLLYAWSENFILPFSHDEVTHGKGSMINKMPGDDWQKFANLRALYTFMWGHPGKKLLFMGQEFGQYNEWDAESSLDWHLLDYAPHQGLKRCVADLNRLYARERAFWERDFVPEGFEGVNCDDSDNSTITFIRRSEDPFDFLVFVINFTPVPRHGYRIGVPELCTYHEVFNSDAAEYGGSNTGNAGHIDAHPEGAFNYPASLNIVVPPLGGVIFKPDFSRKIQPAKPEGVQAKPKKSATDKAVPDKAPKTGAAAKKKSTPK